MLVNDKKKKLLQYKQESMIASTAGVGVDGGEVPGSGNNSGAPGPACRHDSGRLLRPEAA